MSDKNIRKATLAWSCHSSLRIIAFSTVLLASLAGCNDGNSKDTDTPSSPSAANNGDSTKGSNVDIDSKTGNESTSDLIATGAPDSSETPNTTGTTNSTEPVDSTNTNDPGDSTGSPDTNIATIESNVETSTDIDTTITRVAEITNTEDKPGEPAIGAARRECQNAPPLPPIAESDPGKSVVVVYPGDNLSTAVYEAPPHTLILIEPGTYVLENTLTVASDNITIRGNSNHCDDIRLIGKGMENAAGSSAVPHGILASANFLKVQNLTIEQVYYHAIAIQAGAEAPQIYNVSMLDTGQQFVKVSAINGKGPDNGRLEYSVLKYTNGSPVTDHGAGIGYTQGISLHGGANWIIGNNRFENINTRDDADHLWNPAVLVWDLSKDTIVENNHFIDVDRAIAFGLWQRADGQPDHSGGIIRNNMVLMRENMYSEKRNHDADAPIILWSSPNTQVLHNTILSNGNTPIAIELRFDSNGVIIANNLTDAPIRDRSTNQFIDKGNVLFTDSSIFINPKDGDLHLASEVEGITNAVATLDNAPYDIDGKIRRVIITDAGADEL